MKKINGMYFRARCAEIWRKREWKKDRESHDGASSKEMEKEVLLVNRREGKEVKMTMRMREGGARDVVELLNSHVCEEGEVEVDWLSGGVFHLRRRE